MRGDSHRPIITSSPHLKPKLIDHQSVALSVSGLINRSSSVLFVSRCLQPPNKARERWRVRLGRILCSRWEAFRIKERANFFLRVGGQQQVIHNWIEIPFHGKTSRCGINSHIASSNWNCWMIKFRTRPGAKLPVYALKLLNLSQLSGRPCNTFPRQLLKLRLNFFFRFLLRLPLAVVHNSDIKSSKHVAPGNVLVFLSNANF